MSAIDTKQVWSSISSDNLESRYEKCRNITEEIYKRINITFQIKQLEMGMQNDDSDQSEIDINELSNETDLFACDKSSISSSEPCEQANNNNEELREKKPLVVSKRPKKRFRKRVKKRQPAAEHTDSDGSSDSALPLSRMVAVDASGHEDRVMGVPNIIIITKDLKPRIKTPDRKLKHDATKDKTEAKHATDKTKATDKEAAEAGAKEKGANQDLKTCSMCSLSFRGERGLRRHMNMTHVTPENKHKHRDAPA